MYNNNMSYPVIYRKRVIEYRKEGHTLEETGKTFKIAVSTIQRWEKQLKEKGDLENKPLNRPFKKINPEKLKEYIKETAEVFNCSTTAVIKAFKRLGITRKKRQHIIKNKTRTK